MDFYGHRRVKFRSVMQKLLRWRSRYFKEWPLSYYCQHIPCSSAVDRNQSKMMRWEIWRPNWRPVVPVSLVWRERLNKSPVEWRRLRWLPQKYSYNVHNICYLLRLTLVLSTVQAQHSEYEHEIQKSENVLKHYRDRIKEIQNIIANLETRVSVPPSNVRVCV